MSDANLVIASGPERRRVNATLDISAYPAVQRVGERFAALWFEAFSNYEGQSNIRAYATAIRDLLAFLARLAQPPAELRFLDELTLDAWVDDMRGRIGRASTRARASNVRVLLANLDVADLHDSLTDGVEMRWRPVVERESAALADLSPGQWAALRKFAKHEVLVVRDRIQRARAVAAAGHHPGGALDEWLGSLSATRGCFRRRSGGRLPAS